MCQSGCASLLAWVLGHQATDRNVLNLAYIFSRINRNVEVFCAPKAMAQLGQLDCITPH